MLSSPTTTVFPPKHIELHPDDANSKVFHAIARAFLSVDNRAMTIKDLAERASHHGLVCQNLSAAAQAITTYLRSHKARCDKQQDQPLLLSHVLSGTPADDDLVPALYSRSGGDSHPVENRLTNFRKGTAVWYLSRATGVSCPFARAGIRLCDYALPEDDRPTSSRRTHQYDEASTSLKRKRPLRGCVAAKVGGASDNEEEEVEERPPKIKLTLRLKPLRTATGASTSVASTPTSASNPSRHPSTPPPPIHHPDEIAARSTLSDEDEDMSVDEGALSDAEPTVRQQIDTEEPWHLPPYPRRSISIPRYTPSTQTYDLSYSTPYPQYNATPPPDSEDETDDFHVTMTRMKDYPEHEDSDNDDMGWDADLDSEGDGETLWESPAPRSPSASLLPIPAPVTVKEEPRDVQGMLDAWEDFDAKVRVPDVFAVLEPESKIKLEETADDLDLLHSAPLNWDGSDGSGIIKQEELSIDLLFPPSPLSPVSSLTAQFSAFPFSDHVDLPPLELGSQSRNATIRPRSKTVPVPAPSFASPTGSTSSPHSLIFPSAHASTSSSPATSSISTSPYSREPSVPSNPLVSLYQSMSLDTSTSSSSSELANISLPPPTPCVSPLQTRCHPSLSPWTNQPKVIVHTCQPCNPPVSATQIEDISVYQMMLGAFQLLRRIDTDFVNISPIVAYSGAPPPVLESIPNAAVITKGSPEACGTWVSLSAAQAYVKRHVSEHTAAKMGLDVFLSDKLVERFPPALQDFSRLNAGARALNQFGKLFRSTIEASQVDVETDVTWNARQQGHGLAWAAGSPSSSVSSLVSSPIVGRSSSAGAAAAASSSQVAIVGGNGPPVSSPVARGPAGGISGIPAPYALTAALTISERHHAEEKEAPLSKTEQELFQELCNVPDWAEESPSNAGNGDMVLDEHDGRSDVDVDGVGASSSLSSCSSLSSSSPSPSCFPSRPAPAETSSPSSSSPAHPRAPRPRLPPIDPLKSRDGESESSAESAPPDSPLTPTTPTPPPMVIKQDSTTQQQQYQPLRRSKRVAHALASTPSGSTGASKSTSSTSTTRTRKR